MRLGTQTASLTNHILSRAVDRQPQPEVGMGATILMWTDRNPATIIAVEGNRITVQEDNAERADSNGMSEAQEYTYTPNPNGCTSTFRMNKRGMWEQIVKNEETGRWNKCSGRGLRIGEREKYYDYSF